MALYYSTFSPGAGFCARWLVTLPSQPRAVNSASGLWQANGCGAPPQAARLMLFVNLIDLVETGFAGADSRLGTVSDLQFVVDVGDVVTHCLQADGEVVRDGGVALAAGD